MKGNSLAFSILLVFVQVLLCGVLNLSPYFLLSLLPVLVLCLPLSMSVIQLMLISFGLGFLVDFLSTGNLGLISLSLVPVALLRNFILELVIGPGIIDRRETLSFKRIGAVKMTIVLAMAYSVYYLIFIWVDGAGMRTVLFNGLRFLISVVVSVLVAIPITAVLTRNETPKWK